MILVIGHWDELCARNSAREQVMVTGKMEIPGLRSGFW